MKTSTMHLMPSIGKIMIALAAASVIGATGVKPAFAEGNDRRAEQQDKDRHRERPRADHDRRADRDRRSEYYQHRVYAPPPVYYVAQPSPGISLFLPLEIRIR
jgi:Ni/Co efflux regulator RcnB